MPKVIEENLPLGASSKYDCEPAQVITYVNKARQLAKMGPGLTQFECPLIPNLSKGEVNRFANEIHKTLPNEDVHVVHAGDGVAVFATVVDRSYQAPAPKATLDEAFEAKVKEWVLDHRDEVLGMLGVKLPVKKR